MTEHEWQKQPIGNPKAEYYEEVCVKCGIWKRCAWPDKMKCAGKPRDNIEYSEPISPPLEPIQNNEYNLFEGQFNANQKSSEVEKK